MQNRYESMEFLSSLPSNGGSSVGTQIVRCREELADAVETALQYDVEVLAEPYLTSANRGRRLGNDMPRSGRRRGCYVENVDYYDYRTKYQDTEEPQAVWPFRRLPAE